jgi:hypothetical protein
MDAGFQLRRDQSFRRFLYCENRRANVCLCFFGNVPNSDTPEKVLFYFSSFYFFLLVGQMTSSSLLSRGIRRVQFFTESAPPHTHTHTHTHCSYAVFILSNGYQRRTSPVTLHLLTRDQKLVFPLRHFNSNHSVVVLPFLRQFVL